MMRPSLTLVDIPMPLHSKDGKPLSNENALALCLSGLACVNY